MGAKGITRFLVFLVLLLFISLTRIANLLTDFWWFSALGFEEIFLISLKTKIVLFLVAGIAFFIFAYGNMRIASHFCKEQLLSLKAKTLIIVGLSFFIGAGISSMWFTWLQYFNQAQFNLADPIFMKDVGFYMFSLPFFMAIWGFLLSCVIFTIIIVALVYLQAFIKNSTYKQPKAENLKPTDAVPDMKVVNLSKMLTKVKKQAIIHGTILASLIFILLAVRQYLARYFIMYSKQGIVVGAGYTDVMIYLPIIKILMVFSILIVALFYIWLFYIRKVPKLKKRHLVGTVLVLYAVFMFLGPTLIPAVVQSLKVTPNELTLESPYIENNIKFTRIAYGLDDVEEKDFSVEGVITSGTLANASETIDNVRLLDWRPLTQTYKQTQEIRLYYDLSGIDIDRYDIDGKYTQVMIAPRELDQRQIAQNAKTWVNLHMVYTHGFGAVVSPVNRVTKEGLPDFFVKDIPPTSTVKELEIDKPQIYYGEKENDFVIVNTKTDEFDYPHGSSNKYINYDGEGGVKFDSSLRKLMMVLRFKDIKLLLSSDITPDSKLMFDRSIQRRINKITPFLELDEDPYIVINDGRLFWIQDAYTVSGNFPYSEKLGGINYIRNSVKIIVDAYNGDVTYYVTDSDDPLIRTYARIFPKQFKTINDMPEGLRKQTRYPVDLFNVQSTIYNVYHMDDLTVFYNKEDAWQRPSEIYGTGEQVRVEPYYIIMKLPGEVKEEFVLMTSFSPLRKDNMVAWMAARSDGDNYGKLLLYKFPKDKLVYGPLQIEAKFDQDSDISQQLTLWSQQGSRVTRGNLLVIPIDDSLLYIEPLYMQAEKGKLPQLKRVLVSDGERVVMEETLGEALEVLFGKAVVKEDEVPIGTNLAEEANKYYEKVLKAMEEQDWSGMGENFDKLGNVLDRLKD